MLFLSFASLACGTEDASKPALASPTHGPSAAAPPPTSNSEPSPPPALTAWARPYLGDVQIDGITSDTHGDIYSAGYFVSRADFGSGNVLESVAGADGTPTKDIYVAKHARSDGAVAWVRHYGGPGHEGNVYDLTFASGLVVASGAFSGKVDFDGHALESTVSAGTGSASSGTYGNMFVAGFSADGRASWALQSTGNVVSGGNEVAPAPSGGFVQVGMFGGRMAPGGTMTIAGRSLSFEGGGFDTYVAAFDASAGLRWIVPVSGAGAQRGKAIATDAAGNVLVAGDAWGGETKFAPGKSFTSGDAQDFWVAKYDAAGTLLWFRSYASSGIDEVKGIAAAPDGNIVVAASFSGSTLDLGGGMTAVAAPGVKNTGVVFALAPDASRIVFTNTISAVGKCCEIEVDARGHTFAGNAALGPTVRYDDGSQLALGSPTRGALLTELDRSGRRVGAWTIEADDSELGELTLLGDGGLALAGSFVGSEARFEGVRLAGTAVRTQFVLALPPR